MRTSKQLFWIGAPLMAALALVLVIAGCPEGPPPVPAGSTTTEQPADDHPASDQADDTSGATDDSAGTADDSAGSDDQQTSTDDNTGDQPDGSDTSGDQPDGDGGDPTDNPGDDQTTIQTAFTIDPAGLDGKYLMAFLACDDDGEACSLPVNHKVYLAVSDNGTDWTVPADWQPYTGSVPDVIERDNKLYIYTPNEVVIIDETTGEVSEPIEVQIDTDQLPAGFVDPSPILDDQGRIVLFFLPGSFGAIGTCPGGETTCTIEFFSATETDARDGIHFTLDEGTRAAVDLDITTAYKTATDPDIFYDGSQYVLYISEGASMAVYTSDTLRGSYTLSAELPGGLITDGTGGVGCAIFDATSGSYWTFAHATVDGLSVIRRAVHADLSTQLAEDDFSTVLTGPAIGLSDTQGNIASPGVWVRE